MNPWIPQSPEHEASAAQVAKREAEYDRIAPRWRDFRDATSFLIAHRHRYIERRPYDGAWTQDAAFTTHASRFTFDGAARMIERLAAIGIHDAFVMPNSRSAEQPNITQEQVESGELELLP